VGGNAGDGGVGSDAVEAHRLGQVDLGDQHQIGAVEDRRVFERLVFALGGGEQQHPQALAQVVGAGAHQVAHVFDHQQLELGQGDSLVAELMQPFGHQRRLQVAGLACGDLHGANPGGLEATGVVVGGQVAHDHRETAGIQVLGQGFEQGRLAGAGRGEQVDHRHPGGLKTLAQGGGLGVVALQQGRVQGQLAGWLRERLRRRLSAGAVAAHGDTGLGPSPG
jgi:hypothetical protein